MSRSWADEVLRLQAALNQALVSATGEKAAVLRETEARLHAMVDTVRRWRQGLHAVTRELLAPRLPGALRGIGIARLQPWPAASSRVRFRSERAGVLVMSASRGIVDELDPADPHDWLAPMAVWLTAALIQRVSPGQMRLGSAIRTDPDLLGTALEPTTAIVAASSRGWVELALVLDVTAEVAG